jgi:hypothetical protein
MIFSRSRHLIPNRVAKSVLTPIWASNVGTNCLALLYVEARGGPRNKAGRSVTWALERLLRLGGPHLGLDGL